MGCNDNAHQFLVWKPSYKVMETRNSVRDDPHVLVVAAGECVAPQKYCAPNFWETEFLGMVENVKGSQPAARTENSMSVTRASAPLTGNPQRVKRSTSVTRGSCRNLIQKTATFVSIFTKHDYERSNLASVLLVRLVWFPVPHP